MTHHVICYCPLPQIGSSLPDCCLSLCRAPLWAREQQLWRKFELWERAGKFKSFTKSPFATAHGLININHLGPAIGKISIFSSLTNAHFLKCSSRFSFNTHAPLQLADSGLWNCHRSLRDYKNRKNHLCKLACESGFFRFFYACFAGYDNFRNFRCPCSDNTPHACEKRLLEH